MKYIYRSLLLFSTLLFVACGGGSKNSQSIQNSISKDISVATIPHVESIGMAKNVHAEVSLGQEPKDVYVLLSNYGETNGAVEIKNSNKRTEKTTKYINKNHFKSTTIHAPHAVELFRKQIKTFLDKKQINTAKIDNKYSQRSKKDVEGTEKIFYFDENAQQSTVATVRKSVSASTIFGVKTLNIWVANDSFGVGCPKVKCINQAMINALADSFLKPGLDNDIYDWVSNVYGQEWSGHNNSNLIGVSNEVTILLSDIDNDNSQHGGVIGYFFPKDNFKKESISGSNERIMLYADAVLFANGNSTWNIDDFWPKEMVSTLAHEFQHMIHFYQKSVLLADDATDTWINEMLSESTEDLVASKIRHSGSRGVDYRIGSAGESGNVLGRYPLFNANNRLSLTAWYGGLENYSTVNAFGAFLLRNYGGAKVLHDIVHNNLTDKESIVHAVQQTPQGQGKSFNDLIKEWGVAVLLSDHDNLGVAVPHYNTGGYMPAQYNQSVYALGSVNFFNYNPQPNVFNAVGTVQSNANYYYKVGTKLTGKINIDLKLNGQTEATLIVK